MCVCVSVCSLRYPCNTHAPYCHLWPAPALKFTYLLTPWSRVLLEKLTGLQLVKKFPAFYGTRRFITALTSVRHLSLSWASPIQSTYPHPTSWRYILILSTHLRLGLSSGLFPSGFPTKTLYASLSSPIRATCPTHLILLGFITRTILGEEYRSRKDIYRLEILKEIDHLGHVHVEERIILKWPLEINMCSLQPHSTGSG